MVSRLEPIYELILHHQQQHFMQWCCMEPENPTCTGEALGSNLTVFNGGIPLAQNKQKSAPNSRHCRTEWAQPCAQLSCGLGGSRDAVRAQLFPTLRAMQGRGSPSCSSAQSHSSSCCLRVPRASKGELKIRDKKEKHTGIVPRK